MKTNSIIALILSISLFGLFGCADKYEVDYEAPVKIELRVSIRIIEYH